MKKLWVFCIAAMILVAAQASAGTVTVQWVADHYASPGGEFTLHLNNDASDLLAYQSNYSNLTKNIGDYDQSFQTFCIEYDEHIAIGGTYTYQISDRAMNGGVHPDGIGDPLSQGAAWLYSQFATGQLSGYFYGTATSARDLQNAIWWLEEEGGSLTAAYTTMLINQFGSTTNAQLDNNGKYAVKVLNLTNANGVAQDQLIYVPDGGLTVLLLGLGVGGIALFSRRFNNQL